MTGRAHVADLLADPLLDGAVTLAGHTGLERRVVDVSWYAGRLDRVEDHLLVCDEAQVSPPYKLDALVRRAQEAGAAALLITASDARPLLSSIRLADRLSIPVLRLANTDPVGLLYELTIRIRAPELVRARIVESLVRRLGAEKSGQDILRAAEEVLSLRLSLVASDGSPILGEPVAVPPDLRLDLAVRQRSERLLVHPVRDQGMESRGGARAVAWLACSFERADDDRLETISVALAMTEPFLRAWLTGQRARADRDAVLQARLLTEVLAGRDTVSRDVVERALSLGWRLQDWHVGIHLVFDTPRPEERDTLLTQLRTGLRRHGVHTVAAVDRGDGWAAWTSAEREPPADHARRLVRALRIVLAALPCAGGLVAGIGRPHPGPGGLADTLTEAGDAACLARSHEFRPAVEHADELGVARLLATWQQSDVTRAFAETALAPLRAPEHGHLLATLRVFLESGGSVITAAQTLGVHRNTVGIRLRQLRERLGIDLDDPNQRLALQMACRALDASG